MSIWAAMIGAALMVIFALGGAYLQLPLWTALLIGVGWAVLFLIVSQYWDYKKMTRAK